MTVVPNGSSPVAELSGAHKKFGKVTALAGVDLSLGKGELLAVLGPNGAGKTTAIRMMLGVLQPDSGNASLFGMAPDQAAARSRIGVMLQVSGIPEALRVGELVRLFRGYYPNPLSQEESLKLADLKDLERRQSGALSGGQRQRLLFALAVCGRPELLFLDEPTVGMDVGTRRLFWRQIRRHVEVGGSVLLTTHYLEEADALADRIAVIDQGRLIAEGSPAEIKAKVPSRRVRFRSELTEERLRALPGVQAVLWTQGKYELLTHDAEETVRALLQTDGGVADLEVTGAGLEEAFLSLTANPKKEEVRV